MTKKDELLNDGKFLTYLKIIPNLTLLSNKFKIVNEKLLIKHKLIFCEFM